MIYERKDFESEAKSYTHHTIKVKEGGVMPNFFLLTEFKKVNITMNY